MHKFSSDSDDCTQLSLRVAMGAFSESPSFVEGGENWLPYIKEIGLYLAKSGSDGKTFCYCIMDSSLSA